ncbi:MAG: molybdopterin oxidoreductase family protein, partial [Candidatus Dormibacteria bacterium]
NERTQTTCTQCSLGCALQVDVRHGEIARTMSLEEDPVSDGWLCDRGRYNIGYVNDARRLVSPLLRAGDGFEQLAWDDAIALVAEKVRAALAAGGPQRIGIVGGGRLLNEELLGLRALAEGLGVRNLDWRASRQRAASFGPGGTPAQLEAAQTILELGNSLAGTAPVLDLRVRKALLHHGARLVSVGSVGASGGRSGVTSELVASVDEISASAFAVERLALVWDGEDPALAAAALARCEAAGVVSCATYVAGEVPNARGAEAFGIVPPAGGLGVRAQLEAAAGGELDVLLIVGANPLLRFPDRALVLRALERAPFVVASELFLTESAAHASLVLPVKSAFEKDGHTANCSGEVLPVRAALAAPEGPLSDLEIFVALAAELGLAFPAPSELSRRAATFPLNGAPHEPATAVPNSANAAARAAEQAPPSARLRLVVMQDIFSGGGTSA